MAPRSGVLVLGISAGAVLFRSTVFVPPPAVKSHGSAQVSSAACAAALLGSAQYAHADEIGDAAATLSKAAYPFMKEVPWNSNLFNVNPGSQDAVSWTKAIGKMIDMGAAMDPKLLQAGNNAHHAAMASLSADGVCSEAQLTAINAAIGRMIASVPESTTMGVYNAVSKLVDPKVPEYLMSQVKDTDAKAAYAALLDFTSVVKSHPITASAPVAAPDNGAIGAASAKLSAAAYPLIQDIDWTSKLFSTPLPARSPQAVMKAVDKMIVMGASMDQGALREAAQAHVKAIDGMDGKGVLSQADFEAINTGLGKAISSVPTSQVMDVYNSMADLLSGLPVPNYLYSQVKPQDAQAAYNALLDFKDVVKASQR